jgi:hypothetical protein
MLPAIAVAMTLSLAATGESFHERGSNQIRVNPDLGVEVDFTLAQGQRGLATIGIYPRHI